MFGPRFNTVFASRWRALWFAGSMLLLAYCSVPAPEQAGAKQAAEQAHKPANAWWAKDTAG